MTVDVPRDRWLKPLVVPPQGGEPIPYQRASSFGKVLDDTFFLELWGKRMVALGLAERPDLQLGVVAHRDDKKKLNSLCKEAVNAAKGSAAATTGTALHALTEQLDRGVEMSGAVPTAYLADLHAYADATEGIEWLRIEEFMVQDELQVAGTPDRVALIDGAPTIVDLKSGASIHFGIGTIAVQLAIYAHSAIYTPDPVGREVIDGLDQDRALVLHMPAGSGTCTRHWVDVKRGWEGARLAADVRGWRGGTEQLAVSA